MTTRETGARLLTFGEAMGLITMDGIGSLDIARQAHIGIGGAESNVAIGVARLGGSATWIGRVGPDAVGRLITRQLTAAGVQVTAVPDPSYTGLMIRHRRAGNAAEIDYHRRGSAGSRLGTDDLPDEQIRQASVLHVTGITPALSDSARHATVHAVEVARAAGVTVSLDVNYRSRLWSADQARATLAGLAARSDILFAGVNEARLLTGRDRSEPSELAWEIAQLGPPQVLLKDGIHGCLALDGQREITRPAVEVGHVVDPVGAGDAFVAGFLAEHLTGAPFEQCVDTALAMGAFAVSVPGDCELLPTRAELRAFTTSDEVCR